MENQNRPYKITRRRRFIHRHLDVMNSAILEVGAFDCPTFTSTEANVKFLDWYTTQEIRSFASGDTRREKKSICEVDYAVKAKHFSEHIPRKFGLFIANHVIEHVPDVISWLQQIERVLVPGGSAFLSVPDRRYTFDFLRRETTITDLLRCYDLDLEKPDVWQIFDAMYFNRKIVRSDVDSGTYIEKLDTKLNTVSEALRKAKIRAENYVSLHCSVFSYLGFADLFNDIIESGLVNLKLVECRDVQPRGQEFHVLLRKS